MTKKRFKQYKIPADVIDLETGRIYCCVDGNSGLNLCEFLNKQEEHIKQLTEENSKLKEENIELEKFRYSFFKSLDKLHNEKKRC